MFKFAHKISSYGDESRIDFNVNKRKRNFRLKNKVLYLKDQTVLLKHDENIYWYKFLYVMNDKYVFDCTIYHYVLKNNILHRNFDKPTIIYSNGAKYWYLNGILHREDDKPAIISSTGAKYWYLNGKKHREDDKPAIIYSNGSQDWYFNGVPHREGGLPAIIWSNGTKYWFLNGVEYTP